MSKVVLIAAGGTGGHVLPAMAISDELAKIGLQAVIIGTGTELEMSVSKGALYKKVSAAQPSLHPLRFLKFLGTLRKGQREAEKIIDELKPIAVLGMGNYTSVPLVLAARKKKVPIALHEQNAIGGRANRLLQVFADVILVGFEGTKGFNNRKVEVVGNPLRWKEMPPFAKRAYSALGLDPKKKTIVAFGGSRGAKAINKSVLSLPDDLLASPDLQWLVITGTLTHHEARSKLDKLGLSNVKLLDYLKEMENAYSVANVMVARGGAMTVSELECSGVPAVIVPRELSIDGDQDQNAIYLVKKSDCIIIRENNLTEKLAKAINIQLEKQRKPRPCLHTKAAATIAQIIKELA